MRSASAPATTAAASSRCRRITAAVALPVRCCATHTHTHAHRAGLARTTTTVAPLLWVLAAVLLAITASAGARTLQAPVTTAACTDCEWPAAGPAATPTTGMAAIPEAEPMRALFVGAALALLAAAALATLLLFAHAARTRRGASPFAHAHIPRVIAVMLWALPAAAALGAVAALPPLRFGDGTVTTNLIVAPWRGIRDSVDDPSGSAAAVLYSAAFASSLCLVGAALFLVLGLSTFLAAFIAPPSRGPHVPRTSDTLRELGALDAVDTADATRSAAASDSATQRLDSAPDSDALAKSQAYPATPHVRLRDRAVRPVSLFWAFLFETVSTVMVFVLAALSLRTCLWAGTSAWPFIVGLGLGALGLIAETTVIAVLWRAALVTSRAQKAAKSVATPRRLFVKWLRVVTMFLCALAPLGHVGTFLMIALEPAGKGTTSLPESLSMVIMVGLVYGLETGFLRALLFFPLYLLADAIADFTIFVVKKVAHLCTDCINNMNGLDANMLEPGEVSASAGASSDTIPSGHDAGA